MDHELLHNDPDYDLRLSIKVKKEKDKTDPGERKKWNFRKTSASEASGNDGPSSTFGLINQSSETRSKKPASPTMIFENTLSDHDEPNDIKMKSPPAALNLLQSPAQQTRLSTKAAHVDQRQGTTITRARQRSLPSSTSPPPMIQRPQSVRTPGERIGRQGSVPNRRQPATLLQQQSHGRLQSYPSPSTQPERSDLTKTINELQTNNNQWQSIQQPFFTSDNLSNVMPQENQLHRARALSDKDTPGVEIVDDKSTMWQGNQELIHGNWTEFLSPSNEVFVPDDRAWAGAENVVVDVEDDGDVAPGNTSHSSRSSNSSESDNEDTEESVWKINDEQKAYYLNQFRILQPAEKGVVAGQKARDFFLKSGLGTEVLSKIWNLADLDSDGALNFEEFCIAMHIVVAVRHGLEVPAALPQYLMPEKYESQAPNPPKQMDETNSNELSLKDSSQLSWARFSPDPRTVNQVAMSETDGRTVQSAGPTVQGSVQHSQQAAQHAQHGSQHVQQAVQQVQSHCQHVQSHGQQIGQPVQQVTQHAHQVGQHTQQAGHHAQQVGQHAQQVRPHPQATSEITQHNQQIGQHAQPVAQHEQPVSQPVQQIQQQAVNQQKSTPQPAHRLERTLSDPSSADENTPKDSSTPTPRKISVGIPRVRGQPKPTNLLDTPHWAILPPPSKFKENPEEASKGNQFVPTGTIIPADPKESEHSKPVFTKPEKPDQTLKRESDSSSSETEQVVKVERPKSSSNEVDDSESSCDLSKNSSDNSLRVSQDSVDGSKKLPAPVPPPRRRSGHSRSSSLDLQKLFNNKAATTPSFQESMQSRDTQENFADFSTFENTHASHSNENIARFGHRRSASLDSTNAPFVEPTAQPSITEGVEAKDSSSVRHEVSASVPRPVPKKKPASPPPPLRQKKDGQQDSGSDTMVEKEKKVSKEPIHFVVKPLTRLEQLHAKIRVLKTKNTRLSRINNELGQELKEMMETRVGLESSLEQLKPFAK